MEPAGSRFLVKVPGQQPCLEDEHNAAVVRAFVVGVDAVVRFNFAAVVDGQFEPSGSLFSVLVPRQQPCADDWHRPAFGMAVVILEPIDKAWFEPVVGQFDPAASRFRVFVPRQHPCLDDKQNAAAPAVPTLCDIGVALSFAAFVSRTNEIIRVIKITVTTKLV